MNIKKVVVIGPESTGKSTLSCDLARELNTVWVPEYAREYLEGLHRRYEEADLLEIARWQLRMEDELSLKANNILICDTDLFVLKVWSEHSFGRCSRLILEQIAGRRYDLYLLCDIDTVWEDDPLREHPEEGMRQYFYHQYRDIVINSGVPWTLVSGPEPKRLQTALEAIHHVTKAG